ncbi:MAG: hypothetical protein LHW64_07880, partial [Candidatus Cloacimonetes bacterium]|nr:hypothetical protein [Candidatus Cloacimonadota bacterium]MDY0230030.1 hypothetical protein [Candidatus Cloacimonadaceae bacterium]
NLGMLHSITTYLIRKDAFSLGTTYYWSVQAIDNSFSRSSFAPESTFEATSVDDLIGEIEQYEGIGGRGCYGEADDLQWPWSKG